MDDNTINTKSSNSESENLIYSEDDYYDDVDHKSTIVVLNVSNKEKSILNVKEEIDNIDVLIDSVLDLDGQSDSPILISYFLYVYKEQLNPSNEFTIQKFNSIFTEMNRFLLDLDLTHIMAEMFLSFYKINILTSTLVARRKKEVIKDNSSYLTELEHFIFQYNKIQYPICNISSIQIVMESARKLNSLFSDIESNKENVVFIEIKKEFDIMYKHLAPISLLLLVVDLLNKYAKSIDSINVDPIVVNIPHVESLELGTYQPCRICDNQVNDSFSKLIHKLVSEINAEGLIISKMSDNSTFPEIYIPDIYDFLQDLSNEFESINSSDLSYPNFASQLRSQVVDGKQIFKVIKELKVIIEMKEIDGIENKNETNILKRLELFNKLHLLFYLIEIGGFLSYTNSVYLTYLRFYCRLLSGQDLIGDHPLLEPISCKQLVDANKLLDKNNESCQLLTKINLLNKIKTSLAHLFKAAISMPDGEDYNNIRQWIDFVAKINSITDVEGAKQIIPLCVNLNRLPDEFSNVTDDLWNFVHSEPLSKELSHAWSHIQTIFSTEYNDTDITESYTDIYAIRVEANIRDYTKFLDAAIKSGFVRKSDDYELGKYGRAFGLNSFESRFIEHHWSIDLNQFDEFLNKFVTCSPIKGCNSNKLTGIIRKLGYGCLCLETTIELAMEALEVREFIPDKTEFSNFFSELHTFVSFIELHDTLSQLVGNSTESPLISFMMTRTFNYLRFVKYFTTPIIALYSAGLFTKDHGKILFYQVASLRRKCTTVNSVMTLTENAVSGLSKLVDLIQEISDKNGLNIKSIVDQIFFCLEYFVNAEETREFAEALKSQIKVYVDKIDKGPKVLHLLYRGIEEKIKSSSSPIDPNLFIVQTYCEMLLTWSRIVGTIDSVRTFLENPGYKSFTFKDLASICNVETSGTKNALPFAFSYPRPEFKEPLQLLDRSDQNKFVVYLRELIESKQKLQQESLRYKNLIKDKEDKMKFLDQLDRENEELLQEFFELSKQNANQYEKVNSLATSKSRFSSDSTTPNERKILDYVKKSNKMLDTITNSNPKHYIQNTFIIERNGILSESRTHTDEDKQNVVINETDEVQEDNTYDILDNTDIDGVDEELLNLIKNKKL